MLLGDEGYSDSHIAVALRTGSATQQRFVESNLEDALHEKNRPGGERELDEKGAAVKVDFVQCMHYFSRRGLFPEVAQLMAMFDKSQHAHPGGALCDL
ncbi:MAG: hypothetical protein JXA33_03795 [Anaerolineae bacterium]|nr:hypothetical protein [Anaerolineae bacterium]